MTCHNCRIEANRFGKHRNGLQRFRCAKCRKTFTEAHEKPLEGMTTPQDKALLALRLLVEGCSIRSIERTTGIAPRYHRQTARAGWREVREAHGPFDRERPLPRCAVRRNMGLKHRPANSAPNTRPSTHR
jgi:transposase-like protein